MAGLHGCEAGELLEEFMVLLRGNWGEEEEFMHFELQLIAKKRSIGLPASFDMFPGKASE